jgi:hypothetical protein
MMEMGQNDDPIADHAPEASEAMAAKKTSKNKVSDPDELRDKWLGQLQELIKEVEGWAKEIDWSTRRIEKKMEDSQVGTYKAPALILQKETVRVLVEPIARSAPGTEGLVDLYLLPAYDDIASLYFYDGGWQVHYPFPETPIVGNIRETERRPLTKEALGQILDEMVRNAA